jgi:OHCU decarboxylase
MTVTLADLNRMDLAAFEDALGETFELAPWVAAAAHAGRPFATVTDLHTSLMGAVRAAPRETQLAFLRNHPDLAGKAARAGAITEDSKSEQASAGLDTLSEEEFVRFHRLNDAYKVKFGFPFMVCVRRHTRDSILAQFERRLSHDEATEFAIALQEVFYITRVKALAAKDAFWYVVGRFEEPESMRWPLWDEDCRRCHDEFDTSDVAAWQSARFHQLPVHNTKLGVACVECHTVHEPGGNPEAYFLRAPHVRTQCARCHAEFEGS